MTTEQLAAAILRDVPRYEPCGDAKMRKHQFGNWLSLDELADALTRALGGDDLVERAGEVVPKLRDKNCCESPNCNCDTSADLITALLARVAALRAEVEWWKQDDRAAWDKCEERRIAQKAAEAEVARLTVERDEATAGMFAWMKKAEKDAACAARLTALTGAVTFALSEYDAPNDIHEAMSKLRTALAKDAALEPVAAPDPIRIADEVFDRFEAKGAVSEAFGAAEVGQALRNAGLMDPAAIRDAALREAADLVDAKLARLGFPYIGGGSREEMRDAILTLIPKGAADDR